MLGSPMSVKYDDPLKHGYMGKKIMATNKILLSTQNQAISKSCSFKNASEKNKMNILIKT